MANFVLLLHDDPATFAGYSPEEMQAIIQRYARWRQSLEQKGTLKWAHKLEDGTARTVRGGPSGVHVTDGPFTESKEVVGGIFVLEAENYEAAVEISRSCPHLEFGAIELRKVDQV